MDNHHKKSKSNITSLPDYIGLWTEGPFNENSFKGEFRIYINKRNPISKDYELIEGFLEDEFGRASLEGAISSSEILFHAKYVRSHLENYKDFETKYYSGSSIKPDVYKGTYGFKEGKSEEITYYDTLKFIIKKFNLSHINELEELKNKKD